MSNGPGAYTFLSWLRRGIGAAIAPRPGDGERPARVTVPVSVTLNDGALAATAAFDLAGAADVAAIDPRAVSRTWPLPDVFDAESNLFPLVEFGDADFPWRFTPASADGQNRLPPWLSLIALEDDEIDDEAGASPGRPLPRVTIASAAVLPDLSQSWAWAHVQVTGDVTVTPDQLAAHLDQHPGAALARLLCPRRLDASRMYSALVVPALEIGRRAGLGETVDPSVDPLTPAWTLSQRRVTLPVYYRWRFATGPSGDFEQLVRRLVPRTLPAGVGVRPLDVSSPGAGLPAASDGPLGIDGALRPIRMTPAPWADPARSRFVEKLSILLATPLQMLAGAAARSLTPPLYGCWHAAAQRLTPRAEPVWFNELNADPRLRVAAGLGAEAVRRNQAALMASAWEQVESVRQANQALRSAQTGRELSARLHARHVASAAVEDRLRITAPLHARVKSGNDSVRALTSRTRLAAGILDAQFRRVSRPLGPLGRRQGRAAPAIESRLLTRLNRAELMVARVPPDSAKLPTLSALAESLDGDTAAGEPRVRAAAPGQRDLVIAIRTNALTAQTVAALPSRARFQVQRAPAPGAATAMPDMSGDADSVAARDFRAAASALFAELQQAPARTPPAAALDLQDLSNRLVASIDPRVTIPAAVRPRLTLAPGVKWQARDPLEPVMVHPVFPRPMFDALRQLGQDWVLPGIQHVPQNTIALVTTNMRFVAAFMVGLNHEMSRELLWNEYPTDQRGTCFRRFWNRTGAVNPAAGSADDIRDIHTWSKNTPLDTSGAAARGSESPLVLLVRGDLLRRYPGAIVYAIKARRTAAGQRTLDQAQQQHPMFAGSLEPDLAFYGFELTPEQARGSRAPGGDPGWFFVLQETPGEPRFGLDAADGAGDRAAAWTDLSWRHLAGSAGDLAGIVHIDLNAALPDTTIAERSTDLAWHADRGRGRTGAQAADIASITLQRPVRIAVHGSNLLEGLS